MEEIGICCQCIRTLALLFIANGSPVVTRNLLGSRFDRAMDFGIKLKDGRPIFGYSKTWRGVLASIVMTTLLAPLLNVPMSLAILFAALVMIGDLLSSFTKRRLGYQESSRSRLLDVIPESLLPVGLLYSRLGLSPLAAILTVIVFFVLEIALSPLLYRLHIRKRPY